MKELKCPKCGSVFSVDEADYASIVGQVKNQEFEAEVKARMRELQRQNEVKQEAETMKLSQHFEGKLSQKEIELSKKDNEIAQLKAQLEGYDVAKKLELEAAQGRSNEEIARLQAQLKGTDEAKRLELEATQAKMSREIARLNSLVAQHKADLVLAVLKAKNEAGEVIRDKEKAMSELITQIEVSKKEATIRETSIKKDYEQRLKEKQEEVDYYKDMKARLSTKMVGETLEQHCSNSFNLVRTSMYPSAYFEKDNDATRGSKGDFIFRDYVDGLEYVSIMFEMKNEMDETATKHRNEDFFAKLDKDRNEKGCEYAVLVSLLEPDSELYNSGIVDVSYRYPKMFVVRPQFFMPLIALLTQASRKSVEYRRELELARQQSVDVTNFETKLNAFRDKFGDHYRRASEKFSKAIQEIDKAISSLQKMREDLVRSEDYLRLANQDTEKLTIKKLTHGNPTMKQMFNDARAAETGE